MRPCHSALETKTKTLVKWTWVSDLGLKIIILLSGQWHQSLWLQSSISLSVCPVCYTVQLTFQQSTDFCFDSNVRLYLPYLLIQNMHGLKLKRNYSVGFILSWKRQCEHPLTAEARTGTDSPVPDCWSTPRQRQHSFAKDVFWSLKIMWRRTRTNIRNRSS